eukprot:359178-Chlamydomonas_euryale.AAC.2
MHAGRHACHAMHPRCHACVPPWSALPYPRVFNNTCPSTRQQSSRRSCPSNYSSPRSLSPLPPSTLQLLHCITQIPSQDAAWHPTPFPHVPFQLRTAQTARLRGSRLACIQGGKKTGQATERVKGNTARRRHPRPRLQSAQSEGDSEEPRVGRVCQPRPSPRRDAADAWRRAAFLFCPRRRARGGGAGRPAARARGGRAPWQAMRTFSVATAASEPAFVRGSKARCGSPAALFRSKGGFLPVRSPSRNLGRSGGDGADAADALHAPCDGAEGVPRRERGGRVS